MSYKFEIGDFAKVTLTGDKVMILSKRRGATATCANRYDVRHEDYTIREFRQFELSEFKNAIGKDE